MGVDVILYFVGRILSLVKPILHLLVASLASVCAVTASILTLHGLFNSNPAGALWLSVCPRKNPVNRRSRFITVTIGQSPSNRTLMLITLLCYHFISTQPLSPFGLCRDGVDSLYPIDRRNVERAFLRSALRVYRRVRHR